MAAPATMAPAKPLDKMMMSAIFSEENLCKSWENAESVFVKYSMKRTLSTMRIAIIGYTIAMIHDIRNNMFSKKPMPKNNTKNNSTEIINTTILKKSPSLTYYP
jgi:hypothetical protein